ncbi:Oidioi.mRNA.OKI2018_I69.chr1.g98.t1.cds [Oikopleura dioica]|uniref:Oidioi.mRNA.OKI2018_I69.chr1.g98.t1.cds n=1 Tax=Oikopleura dioica TaxID=34765 RepID=A0ABN7SMJ8_OIKDI|nr:Oidioi.mRNA.OKI2018_I69.chr1.g98.t1.cds [Oikopleura dioica]
MSSKEKLSNKDACACYRLRMNGLFNELRNELKKENFVKVDRYKMSTKAGLLLATIDALKKLVLQTHIFRYNLNFLLTRKTGLDPATIRAISSYVYLCALPDSNPHSRKQCLIW